MLQAADLGSIAANYRKYAKKLNYYALGDGGRSYVVRIGTNPPARPYHRSRKMYLQVTTIYYLIHSLLRSVRFYGYDILLSPQTGSQFNAHNHLYEEQVKFIHFLEQ